MTQAAKINDLYLHKILEMRYLLHFIIFIVSCQVVNAQEKPASYCGTPDEENKWLDYYLDHKEQFHTENDLIVAGMRLTILGNDNGTGYFQPVSILDALCRVNLDFAEANIQMHLSEDFNYVPNTYWNVHEDFNAGSDLIQSNPIFGAINAFISTGAAGNCGYSWQNAVVMAKSCTGPADHTFAHELGHHFSLPHTFNGWEGIDYDPDTPTVDYSNEVFRPIENVNDNGCSNKADRFCDTPADYLSYRWPCDGDNNSTAVQTDLNGETFQSDGSLFMSYALDNCTSRFSAEQIDAMRANIQFDRPEIIMDVPIVEVDDSDMQLIYPAQDDLVPNNGLTLRWEAVPGATQYLLEVTRHPFTQIKYANLFVKDTFFNISDLPVDKTLSYKIRPFNEGYFCTQWSERVTFETFFVSNTNDIEVLENLSIYPTLVEKGNLININFSSKETLLNSQVVLKDLTGKTIQNLNIDILNGENIFEIMPASHSAGIYILGIETREGNVYRKVIFQ